eukprot:1121795-Alexandrium_andersonii.AAC.1
MTVAALSVLPAALEVACGGDGGASPAPSIPRSLPRGSSVAVALAFACWRRRARGLAFAVGRRMAVTGSL